MGTHWREGGYSATVVMYLLVNGERHSIAKIGRDSMFLRHNAQISNGHAQLVIRVDDHEEIQDVILHHSDPVSGEVAYV